MVEFRWVLTLKMSILGHWPLDYIGTKMHQIAIQIQAVMPTQACGKV